MSSEPALAGLWRTIVSVVGGRQGFGRGALEIKESDVIGAGMKPRARREESEFRTDKPEAAKRLRAQECGPL